MVVSVCLDDLLVPVLALLTGKLVLQGTKVGKGEKQFELCDPLFILC